MTGSCPPRASCSEWRRRLLSGTAILTAGIAGPHGGCAVDGRRRVRVGELAARLGGGRPPLEERELRDDPAGELRELARIYERRGLPPTSRCRSRWRSRAATRSAAHARDELGLDEERRARPLQAAWASAVAFSTGAILPLVAIGVSPRSLRVVICVAVTLIALALLGDTGARLGGARRLRATSRVVSGAPWRWR